MRITFNFAFVLLLLLAITSCFEFKSPFVSANPTTINTLAQYAINLQRQFTWNVTNTAWNTSAVPAGSSITVVFPVEFVLSGAQTCDMVVLGANIITGYTSTVNTSSNTITITNAIPTSQYISDVALIFSNVLNPAPAITTSAFLATIGIDYTANDPFSAVSFTPDVFNSATLGFLPAIVNTTGDIVVTLVNTNRLPVGAYLEVRFPGAQAWAEDVAANNHKLPILSTMACASLSPTLNAAITCSGQSSIATVTISNLSNTAIPAQSTLKFSIQNLFSPPTQNPIDLITITSLISGYGFDTISSPITGLMAKNLTDLTITPTTSLKTINTNIGLRVAFTLQDTITNVDYFQIGFPLGTVVTYSTSLSSFSLATNNVTYNSNTAVLTFYQSTLSQTRFAGFFANITFVAYRTPNTTKPTDPIVFRVMKNGYAKMRGSAIFTADPKQYSFTATPNDTNINAYVSFQVSFNLADALDRTGYLILTIPSELTIQSLTCSITSSSPTSINPSPTLTPINATTYKISNLNRTSTSLVVPVQTLTLNLLGLQMPNSVRTLGSFGLSVYFGSQGYLNAGGIQGNTVVTVGGVVIAGVAVNTTVTASLGTLTLTMNLQNSIPAHGFIYIAVPSQISLSTLTSTTLTFSSTNSTIPISTTTPTGTTLSLSIPSLIPPNTSLTLTLTSITTPISTARSSNFSISTTNQNNLTIDTMPVGVGVNVVMTQPGQFGTISLGRLSAVNNQVTQYGIGVGFATVYGTVANWMGLEFPTEVGVGNVSGLVVSWVAADNTSTTLPYTILSTTPLKLTISLPTPTTTISHTILLQPLTNPPSLKQTPTGILVTLAYNRTENSTVVTYLYARSQTPRIQNTQAAGFGFVEYGFTTGVLFSQGNLGIGIGVVVGGRVGVFSLQLEGNLGVRATGLTTCASPQLPITCSISSVTPAIIQIVPTSASTFSVNTLNITIGPILTPTVYLASYPASILTSYDTSNYVISRNTTIIKFTPSCSMPCRQCQPNLPTNCLSCYTLSQNLTNLLYFATLPNQTYGQCYSSCPSTYTPNPNNTYLCLKCDSSCLECVNTTTTCTSCPNGTYLYLGTSSCVAVCPNGTYGGFVGGSYVCVGCMVGCELCVSGATCSRCSAGYYLYGGVCGLTCPTNVTVANTTTRVCDACNISCLTCQNTTQTCTSCITGLVLNNATCQNSCPNLSMIPINSTCTQCTTPCLTCSITLTNCTSCNTTSTFRYLSNNQCLSACPLTYYASLSTGYVCTSCAGLGLNCTNCTGNGLACWSCDVGFVYWNGLCLGYVPNGYVNISGNVTPCATPCSTCSITTTNCTSCQSPLFLSTNQCVASCPSSTTPLNSTCTQCSAPCSQCTTTPTSCTACPSPYFLNSLTHQCVNSSSGCPNYTYANSTTNSCTQCVSPCLECSSGVSCRSCVRGFYFQSVLTVCVDVCPLGWVGVVDVCVRCVSPCRYCQASPDNCTSCISGYYLNIYTFQCLLQCPTQVTIPNPITMTCDICTSPCQTCQNQTTICTSCRSGTYLLGTQCLELCPDGYYGDLVSKSCLGCSATCGNCVVVATQCTSCPALKYLYNSTCVTQCPDTHAVIRNNTCTSCWTVLPSCLTCTQTTCLFCQPPTILFNNQCLTSCPQGYTFNSDLSICTPNPSPSPTPQPTTPTTEQTLSNSLSSSSVFPMPFTCVGLSIFIACIMSKLQNKNTYLIGAAYCLTGLLETCSLVYLVIRYLGYDQALKAGVAATGVPAAGDFPLLTVGIIIIYVINLIGLIGQTPMLCSDQKFTVWLKNPTHKCLFILTTTLSFLLNYKLKLLLFCKLFSFTSTRAQLQSPQKFKIFNILSFLGVSHQIFTIYISIIMIMRLQTTILNNQLFLIFVDVMVICFIGVVVSVLGSKKEDGFFQEVEGNGYVLNRRVEVEGEDMGKEGLEPKYLKGDQNKLRSNQMDSFQKILDNNHNQQIYEDEELSLSISENRSEIDRKNRRKNDKDKTSQLSDNDIEKSRVVGKKNGNRNQLHFTNQDTSNPMKKQQLHSSSKEQLVKQEKFRHSTIFESSNQPNQQQFQTISKNKTVLLDSPSKPQKPTKITKNSNPNTTSTNNPNGNANVNQNDNTDNKSHLNSNSNENQNLNSNANPNANAYISNSNANDDSNNKNNNNNTNANNNNNNKNNGVYQEDGEGKNSGNKDNVVIFDQLRVEDDGIQDSVKLERSIKQNTNPNSPQNTKQPQNPTISNNYLQPNPNPTQTLPQSQQQSQQQKQSPSQKLRKENETKIFREEKDINKDDPDSQEIQIKIRKKLEELHGLKKESSSKDLKRERERSRERSKAGSMNSEAFKLFHPTNKPQQQHQKSNAQTNTPTKQPQSKPNPPIPTPHIPNIPTTTNTNTNPTTNNLSNLSNISNKTNPNNLPQKQPQNQSQTIPQASTLIKQQQELKKQQYLAEEKLQENIKEEFDFSHSLAISKLEDDGKKDGREKDGVGKDGMDKGKSQKSGLFEIQDEVGQSKLQDEPKSNTNKLKTNNESIYENESLKNIKNTSLQQNQPQKQPKPVPQQIPKSPSQNNTVISATKNPNQITTNPNITPADSNPNPSNPTQNPIKTLYDSLILNNNTQQQQNIKKQPNSKQKQIQDLVKNNSNGYGYGNGNERVKKGVNMVDAAIGDEIEIQGGVDERKINKDKDNKDGRDKRKGRGNLFEFQQEDQSMEESGLEDSRPDMDEQINHHPLKSSFATERRSVDNQKSEQNSSVKHPLIGLLQAGQHGINKNQIPKMADEQETISNREGLRAKGKPPQEKTERRQQERPPLQRPISTEKNRIYAAGLRQFQDPILTKKNSYDNPLGQEQPEMPNKKRNNSLYSVPMNKLQSRQSRDVTSSDHTEDILVRPGYFQQNSSSENTSFVNQKYTSTMLVDSGNQMPDKPTIGFTSRTSFNRVSTSHERGARAKRQPLDQNVTAGDKMFSKKSVEYGQDDEELEQQDEDDLQQFYGKIKDNKGGKSPKRSKSKERNPSKESVKRMKQIQKVYLQRLDLPKRKQ